MKRDSPVVSVIIVSFNGLDWLKICLPSVLQSEYPNVEIIVIDNASTDGSGIYLQNEWKNLAKIIHLDKNIGFASGSNLGFENATGDVIALLNNDTEVDKYWLSEALSCLYKAEEVGAVQPRMMQMNDRRKIDCIGLAMSPFGYSLQIGHNEIDSGFYDNVLDIWGNGGALILKRKVLERTGLFDDLFFLYCEDLDLSWRIKLSGYKIITCKSSLVYHAGSSTTKKLPSSFVVYHSTKNHILLWIKNYSTQSLITKLPISLVLIICLMFYELVSGRSYRFSVRTKAFSWVFRNLAEILRTRRYVQRNIRRKGVTDRDVFGTGHRSNHIRRFLYR